jgi:hypothetical protein
MKRNDEKPRNFCWPIGKREGIPANNSLRIYLSKGTWWLLISCLRNSEWFHVTGWRLVENKFVIGCNSNPNESLKSLLDRRSRLTNIRIVWREALNSFPVEHTRVTWKERRRKKKWSGADKSLSARHLRPSRRVVTNAVRPYIDSCSPGEIVTIALLLLHVALTNVKSISL